MKGAIFIAPFFMQHNATYAISNYAPQPAAVILHKRNLQIRLQNDSEERSLYWHYDEVMQDKDSNNVFAHISYPPQVISVNDVVLANELTGKINSYKRKLFSTRRSTFAKLAAAFVLFIAATYFLILPLLSSLMVNRFPVSYEQKIGEQMYQSMKESFEVDAAKTAYANQFLQQLNIPSTYNIQVTVIKEDVANAYAMPGGHIIVHDKILNDLETYPELAALLTHEFTHIQNRHSLKNLLRQASTNIFLSLIIGDATAAGNVLIANAANLKSLSYSRSLEKEADENGAALLVQRNIDCNGFVHLFEALKKETTVEPSEWISSHPALNSRVKNIKKIRKCKEQTVNNDSVLEALFQKIKSNN